MHVFPTLGLEPEEKEGKARAVPLNLESCKQALGLGADLGVSQVPSFYFIIIIFSGAFPRHEAAGGPLGSV